MVEYALRAHTCEYSEHSLRSEHAMLNDGSVHGYKKQFHFASKDSYRDAVINFTTESISTPIYPFNDHHLPEILTWYEDSLANSYNVLIHAETQEDAELNLLFQYYKIADGSHLKLGLGIFCSNNNHCIINWNKNYTHWSEMQPWELREWFSLFYPSWVREWIDSVDQTDQRFLKISNADLLYNTKSSVHKTIQHCRLNATENLDSFLDQWVDKQQYIVDKFSLLSQIVDCTINQVELTWPELDIISQAIIQQRLREKKFEIQCDGLNIFPSDSEKLFNLLYKC
jgi:hypothetical protein